MLRSTYHTLGPEYYGNKKKVKWYVVDSNTGFNGILMESNTGKFKYVVTRNTWQTVGHVMYHGWVSGMQDGYGFGHR
ncbi:hypothetical protein [Lactobacillus bombicola]|uniref:Uncharacterized protein n=1 Tax=Lactobacillus bombicola TaxID=1505723 RepID=A0A396SVP2_9LACO|nr:hypothetical protein [Lactobacillus bombicola]RHW54730.1 hypothetical protein DS835_03775 [Lactobacillus bombicola]